MHTVYFRIFAGQLVVQVEVAGTFVIDIYFVILGYIQSIVIVYALYVISYQCLELLRVEVQLGHSIIAQQIYFPVLVTGNCIDAIAEKAVWIVLLQLVGLYVCTVIPVQPFTGTNPKQSAFVDVKAVDRKLR